MSYSGKKVDIVIDFINNYIKTNSLAPGSKLLSERELIEKTGVSRVTVRRAISNLLESDVLYSIQGSGYYYNGRDINTPVLSIPMIISYSHNESKVLDIVHSAQKYLQEHHCRLNLNVSGRSAINEQDIITQLYNDGVRCLILFPVASDTNTEFYFSMIKKGMHFVFVDRKPKDIFGYSFVQSDNIAGGYLATKHFIDCGHKKIAMFGFDVLDKVSALYERSLGYKLALKEANIPCPEQFYFLAQYQRNSPDVEGLLDKNNGFTAIFAANDHAAVDIANHARRRGLKIPEDISIIGFDNLDITSVFSPTISTIAQPFSNIGRVAAEIAYNYVSQNSTETVQKNLPVELITRNSTRTFY